MHQNTLSGTACAVLAPCVCSNLFCVKNCASVELVQCLTQTGSCTRKAQALRRKCMHMKTTAHQPASHGWPQHALQAQASKHRATRTQQAVHALTTALHHEQTAQVRLPVSCKQLTLTCYRLLLTGTPCNCMLVHRSRQALPDVAPAAVVGCCRMICCYICMLAQMLAQVIRLCSLSYM